MVSRCDWWRPTPLCASSSWNGVVATLIALRALWGIISYITTATWSVWCVVGRHLRAPAGSHVPAAMYFTTNRTNEVSTRAVSAFLTAQGMPAQCFPWTVGGLCALLIDCKNWNPLDIDSVRSQLLRSDHEFSVVGDLGRWWWYIQQHMREAVEVLYATDASVQ